MGAALKQGLAVAGARGDADGGGPDVQGGVDVAGRIADEEHALEGVTTRLFGALFGEARERAAVGVLIAEGADDEGPAIDPGLLDLQEGAAHGVAGDEAKDGGVVDEVLHAGLHTDVDAWPLGPQLVRERRLHGAEEGAVVGLMQRQALPQLVQHAEIGAAPEHDVVQLVDDAPRLPQGPDEGAASGSVHVDEGAVDVEEDEGRYSGHAAVAVM